MRTVPRNAHELRLRIAADLAELARIEGKQRIVCPHIIAIVERVAEDAGVKTADILGESRIQPVAHARQRVYAVARDAGFSLTHIARAMGRDHTSIIHGIRAEEKRRAE